MKIVKPNDIPITVGANVRWQYYHSYGRYYGVRVKEGVVLKISGDKAKVRFRGNKNTCIKPIDELWVYD